MTAETLMRRTGAAAVLLSLVGAVAWWFTGDGLVARWLGPALERAPGLLALHASLDPAVRDLAYFQAVAMPAGLRFLAGLAAVGAVLAWSPYPARLQALWRESDPPRVLAATRIVVFLAVAAYTDPAEIARFAALPPGLEMAPPGLSWLPLPGPVLAQILAWLTIGAALAAAVGIRPRLAAWLCVAAGVVSLGVPQFFGKINHYHHLLWFASVLAAGPSWQVWSVQRAEGRGRVLPWIWLLIGLIYFFPGFWKWVVAGPSWLDGSALATMLHAQWYRIDAVVGVRFDSGWLAAASGTAVLVFELGFVIALAWRRARGLFVLGALAFHGLTFLVAGISFWSLAVCLVAFAPAHWMGDGGRAATAVAAGGLSDRVGHFLVGAALVTGFAGIDTWPIAVYPTFAGLPDTVYPTVLLETDRGERIDPYRSPGLAESFGQSRIMGLVNQVLQDAERGPALRSSEPTASTDCSFCHRASSRA
ncbi:MAG: hypothetical protein JJ896_12695, partial [Rhodothermales bacterium]|nr:hypothetical protein [Rhodothermales bacterium]